MEAIAEETPLDNDIEANAKSKAGDKKAETENQEEDEFGAKIIKDDQEKDKPVSDKPPKYNTIRTEPLQPLNKVQLARFRRLDRKINQSIPEIHYVGQITHGMHLITDNTQGAFCRFKVSVGKAWEHLCGDTVGQTQVSYANHSEQERLNFSHPIDIHYACAGLQGFGGCHISVQCFQLDWLGRRVLSGYGFSHMPTTAGFHRLSISVWRPVGTAAQELEAFLLGEVPSLLSPDAIYDTAWKDRCRLITTNAGTVFLDLFVVTRFFDQQGMNPRNDPG